MLKSFSTQLAATAFFGPVGLAYTSMATAVLFTLILAVLYFTGFGALAILVIWPLSIVVGVLYVKFHNDRVRQSGNSLLLGPGYDDGMVSAIGSWARGAAVLVVICALAYLAYRFLPENNGVVVPGRIVDASSTSGTVASKGAEINSGDNAIVRTETGTNTSSSDSDTSANGAIDGDSSVPVITLPSREIPKVVVDSSGDSTVAQQGVGESGVGETDIVTQSILYVDREVVNLRQGPGTQYAIVTQLDRNEALYEFARDGDWVNIETESGNYAGWIHGNLVRR
jgi:hypothetical protein